MSLHWLKTRWRTRGEYAATGRRLLWRFGLAVGSASGAGSVRRLDLPAGVDPAALLAPEDRDGRLQSTDVRVRGWRGATLRVESTGHGWVGPPGEPGSRAIHVRCRFDLEVSEQGVRELGRRCGS